MTAAFAATLAAALPWATRAEFAMGELERPWRRAREAWPNIVVDDVGFAHFVATRAAADPTPVRFLRDGLRAEDAYLAHACLIGHPQAIATLEREYLVRLPGALGFMQLPAADVEELMQELRMRLVAGTSPLLDRYDARGRLLAWLRVTAVRMAHRRFGRRHETRATDETLGERAATGDLELQFLKARYRAVFAEALREALRRLEPKLRTVLALHVVDGLSADEIAATHAVHRASVFRWLDRARRDVLDSTRAHVLQLLGGQTDEFEGMFELVRSQLDMSLRSQLTELP